MDKFFLGITILKIIPGLRETVFLLEREKARARTREKKRARERSGARSTFPQACSTSTATTPAKLSTMIVLVNMFLMIQTTTSTTIVTIAEPIGGTPIGTVQARRIGTVAEATTIRGIEDTDATARVLRLHATSATAGQATSPTSTTAAVGRRVISTGLLVVPRF